VDMSEPEFARQREGKIENMNTVEADLIGKRYGVSVNRGPRPKRRLRKRGGASGGTKSKGIYRKRSRLLGLGQ